MKLQRYALAILLGLALGSARSAVASAFRVNPIRIDFDRTTRSALLTLINESSEDLRFQVSAFDWQQAPNGEMKLQPTQEVVFFPALLTLKAGEERKIRIGRTAPPAAVEKTFRVFFEELPPLNKPAEAPARGSQVRILTKIGVPIFVEPEAIRAGGEIASFTAKSSKLMFDVKNTGNVHFIVQSLRVTGLDDKGAEVFNREREGWYVLAGDFRNYDLDLEAADCAKVRKVRIQAVTDLNAKPEDATLKGEFDVPAGMCSGASK